MREVYAFYMHAQRYKVYENKTDNRPIDLNDDFGPQLGQFDDQRYQDNGPNIDNIPESNIVGLFPSHDAEESFFGDEQELGEC